MKNLIITLLLLLGFSTSTFAQGYLKADPDSLPVNYLDRTIMFDSYSFLGPYPAFDSPQGMLDIYLYQISKLLRNSERGELAKQHAHLHGDGLSQAFIGYFPFEISWKNSPAIYYLITHMREDAGGLATEAAKNGYMRQRPFVMFNEHTPLIDEEDEYIGTGSYPSGHSAIGWAVALVLSEIAPEFTTEIMRCGYEIGQSRVILGFHFQSDVDAGRLLASMVLPLLHNNPEFLTDLQAAKDEYSRLMGR